MLSTLVKAMFFNILIPVIFYIYLTRRNGMSILVISGVIAILMLLAVIQFVVPFDILRTVAPTENYFSVHYKPLNAWEFFLWRVGSIPLIVALDTLAVHQNFFLDQHLGLTTSGLFIVLLGMEKINLEMEVFSYQYGGNSGFGNANTGALIEGYVSFGYFGSAIYGICVASILRFLANRHSIDMHATSYLYAVLLVYSSFIATLFSGGLIMVTFIALLGITKFRESSEKI